MLSIEQIRAFYPGFPQDTQTTIHLLKEYIELLVLNHLSNTKYIEKLTFIGGTNLRLIKGIDRFSEDLDFDCKELSAKEFADMTDGVIRFLRNQGLPAEAKESESSHLTAMRRTIMFPEYLYSLGLASEAERNRKFILKIEAQDQGVVYKRVKKMISLDGFYFQFPVPSDSVLCAMKWAALLSRGKGRDFYDTMFLMGQASPDLDFLNSRCGISSIMQLKEAAAEMLSKTDLIKKSRDFEYLIFNKSKASLIQHFDPEILFKALPK